MGISPGRARRARIDQRESESAPINSLGKRKSLKKCVFGCEGKINLVQLPEEPSVTRTVDTVCFSGQHGVSQCVC